MKTNNQHKVVRCKTCCQSMYSKKSKRHFITLFEQDMLAMTGSEVVEELKARHSAKLQQGERRKLIEEMARKMYNHWNAVKMLASYR